MSSSLTAKAAEKKHKETRKIILACSWGQLGGKKDGLQIDLKLSGWMSYPNSPMKLCMAWKKELPCQLYLKQKFGKF